MISSTDIRIIIPAYNEAGVLKSTIQSIQNQGFENVIVIDDGSSDATVQVARNNRAQVVSLAVNRGAGAATQTAIDLAKREGWDYLVLMDADGQHDARDLSLFLDKMSHENWDIIIGNRFTSLNNDIPRSRIGFNKLANLATNYFCTSTFNDTQCGFRMLGRQAIEKLDLKVDGFGFCSEMLILGESMGLKITEVPVRVEYTDYSMSKGQNLETGVSTAFNFIWNLVFK